VRAHPTGSRRRGVAPVSLKVFAILNLLLGGWGLLCSPLAFLGIPTTLRLLGDSATLRLWLPFAAVWQVIGAAALLASGIGLWRRKSWARRLAVFYAAVAMVLSLAGSALFLPAFARLPLGPERVGGLVGGVLGAVLGVGYNLLLVVFLTRRAARVACGEAVST